MAWRRWDAESQSLSKPHADHWHIVEVGFSKGGDREASVRVLLGWPHSRASCFSVLMVGTLGTLPFLSLPLQHLTSSAPAAQQELCKHSLKEECICCTQGPSRKASLCWEDDREVTRETRWAVPPLCSAAVPIMAPMESSSGSAGTAGNPAPHGSPTMGQCEDGAAFHPDWPVQQGRSASRLVR